jgi:hypothetical protein
MTHILYHLVAKWLDTCHPPLVHPVEEIRTALNTPLHPTAGWEGGGGVSFNSRTRDTGQSYRPHDIQPVTETFSTYRRDSDLCYTKLNIIRLFCFSFTYYGVPRSFRTGHLERELQMVSPLPLSAIVWLFYESV